MQKTVKYTMLNFLQNTLQVEHNVNPERIFEVNKTPVKDGDVIWLAQRELRANDNFSLNFAIQKAKELNKHLKIIHLKQYFETEAKQNFYENQLSAFQNDLRQYDFEIKNDLNNVEAGVFIVDFNPIAERNFLDKFDCKIYEVDGHNIVPARHASDKQEYNAATFRRKIYYKIYEFMTEFPKYDSGKSDAEKTLADFIENKLDFYAEFKNDPNNDVTSGLSKFLNLGFISLQRVAIEVIKSNASTINKETFLEELVVRGGLSDNFCLYCKDFRTYNCVPKWAKTTLSAHKTDIRQIIYSLREFEEAKTYDALWNITQKQLLETGKIHGYLRMYWAKKILEWSASPEEALKIAIYLNDKYAFDAPSANGYVGILWSIGALHDRAFADRPVIGKIRPMSGRKIKIK